MLRWRLGRFRIRLHRLGSNSEHLDTEHLDTIHLDAVGIGLLTYVVSGSDPTSAWVLAGLVGVTLVLVGGVLLRVPVDLIAPGVADPVDPPV